MQRLGLVASEHEEKIDASMLITVKAAEAMKKKKNESNEDEYESKKEESKENEIQKNQSFFDPFNATDALSSIRHRSRFNFAQESEELMQNDFRALFPNVNISFSSRFRLF